jgi:quinol monooxygenase YgiN
MTDGVIVLIHFQAQSGQAAVARRELQALIAEVVAKEADCRGILLHQDVDDENRFMLYERWTSREAYTGPHVQTPYIQAFMARASGFMVGPPTITFWDLTGDFAPR